MNTSTLGHVVVRMVSETESALAMVDSRSSTMFWKDSWFSLTSDDTFCRRGEIIGLGHERIDVPDHPAQSALSVVRKSSPCSTAFCRLMIVSSSRAAESSPITHLISSPLDSN